MDNEQQWYGKCNKCGKTYTALRSEMKHIVAGQYPGESQSSWETFPMCYQGTGKEVCSVLMHPMRDTSILATAVAKSCGVNLENAIKVPSRIDSAEKFYEWLHSDAIEVQRGIDVIPMPETIDVSKEPFDGNPVLIYIDDACLGTGWIECVWQGDYWREAHTDTCLAHLFEHYLPISAKEK